MAALALEAGDASGGVSEPKKIGFGFKWFLQELIKLLPPFTSGDELRLWLDLGGAKLDW